MANWLAKLPYAITGDDYDLLKKYDPNSRKKISTLGWSALVPTLLWFWTGYIICAGLLGTSSVTGVLAGLVAAFLVFIFEKSIVQSKKVRGLLLGMRIFMALLIGIISSAVIDLSIFDKDIKHYAGNAFIAKLDSSLAIAAGESKTATYVLNQEMDGTGGSGLPGFEKVASEKKRQLNRVEERFKEIEAVRKEAEKILADPNHPKYTVMAEQLGINTILNRLKMLHEIVLKDKALMAAWLILLAIGIYLETFGVFLKWLSPATCYEKDLEAIEIIRANRRRQALENSAYYTNLGSHGRAAKDAMSTSRHLLN